MSEANRSKEKPVKKKGNLKILQDEIKAMSVSIAEHAEVLKDLKGIPDQLRALTVAMQGRPIIIEDLTAEDTSELTEEDPISSLLRNSEHESDTHNEEQDESALDILNSTQVEAEYGPPISADVAASITRLFTQRQSKDALTKINAKIPDNCKALATARVNPEIWSILPPKIKQSDFSYQSLHQNISGVSVVLTKIADTLFKIDSSKFKKENRDDLLRTTLEALTVLGTVTQDINQKRKQEIRPVLNREVASICSNSVTTDLLFGDNIHEQLKIAKSTSSAIRSGIGKFPTPKIRPSPYKTYNPTMARNLNWRAPPQTPRGGNYNRGSRGRRAPQHQFQRSPHPM